MTRGEELDAIMQEIDRTTAEWAEAGYPEGRLTANREYAFWRLHLWNHADGTLAEPCKSCDRYAGWSAERDR
jgi:hypothetical protein